ncbi:MAG: response regulator [Thermoguttaceae bacterium]
MQDEFADATRQKWSKRSRRLALAAVALLGCAVSLALYFILRRQETQWIDARFRFDAQVRVNAIERELAANLAVLEALGAFYAGSRDVERSEFLAFTDAFLREQAGITALAWAERQPLLTGPERSFGEAAKPSAPVSGGTTDSRFPVTFLVPSDYPFLQEGHDVGETEELQAAMATARDSGYRTITSSIYLYNQEESAGQNVFALMPVYRRQAPHATEEQRRQNLAGFYVAVLRLDAMMERAIGFTSNLGIDVQVFDYMQPVGSAWTYLSLSPAREKPFQPLRDPRLLEGDCPGFCSPVKIPGCQWFIVCTPTEAYVDKLRRPLPLVSVLASLMVTTVLLLYLNDILTRAEKVERLVVKRTAELRSANVQLGLEIEQRERAAQGLRDSEALYSSLVESLPVHVLRKDKDGRFTFANRSFCRLLGKPFEEIVGRSDFDFYPRDLAEKYLADDLIVFETGELFEAEEKNQQDGDTRYVHVMKSPVYDASGKIIGTQAIFWDVTARREAEFALENAKEAAESASRAKSAFLANMSHEIRTPMNAILGMTELVLSDSLSARQREYLSVVRESGEALVTVINDILDFSKIEAGKLDIRGEPFDLHDALGSTMKFLAVRAHEKSLELVYRVASDVPRWVVGDSTRLRQVLVNLVGNAIKFTSNGEVMLDVVQLRGEDGQVWIQLGVTDTGIGIAREKLAAIFEAFEQADTSTTRQFGGTGLGLAITHRLVELMGGTISVVSEERRGSCFRVSLPFGWIEDRQPQADEAAFAAVRVLVVDDSQTNRRVLLEILESWNVRADGVATAGEAMVSIREATEHGQPFDVVLVDSTLADPDGFSLAEELVRDGGLVGHVVMMLTSKDRPGDIARCEQMGAASYLSKPLKRSELFNILLARISDDSEYAHRDAGEDHPLPSSLPPLKVLVAEDSLMGQKLIRGILERHGHMPVIVNTGREVVERWQSGTFDVILMDVQMPEMDGLAATALIRQREADGERRTPIIAMTAHAMRGDEERCLAAGMDGYVSKPIHLRRLFEVIRCVMEAGCHPAAESDDPGTRDLNTAAQAEGEPQRTVPTDSPTPPSHGEIAFNSAGALATVGGDRPLLAELIHAYLEEAPRNLAALKDSLERGDAPGFRRAAHTIKASMRYFCFQDGFEKAFKLEKLGMEGDLASAKEGMANLATLMEKLPPLLLDYLKGNNS